MRPNSILVSRKNLVVATSRPDHFNALLRHSENFRTPGHTSCLEDGIRMGNGTREQLLRAQSACKLRPRKSAQIYRAKDADIAAQTGRVVSAVDTGRTDPPAASIARAKFIDDIDNHGCVSLIRPCRHRSLDIEETHPHAVPKSETEPTRLRQQEKERMVEQQKPGFHARHPVDIKQISPD